MRLIVFQLQIVQQVSALSASHLTRVIDRLHARNKEDQGPPNSKQAVEVVTAALNTGYVATAASTGHVD